MLVPAAQGARSGAAEGILTVEPANRSGWSAAFGDLHEYAARRGMLPTTHVRGTCRKWDAPRRLLPSVSPLARLRFAPVGYDDGPFEPLATGTDQGTENVERQREDDGLLCTDVGERL